MAVSQGMPEDGKQHQWTELPLKGSLVQGKCFISDESRDKNVTHRYSHIHPRLLYVFTGFKDPVSISIYYCRIN